MAVAVVSFLVPNGIYRIRSLVSTGNYLEPRADGTTRLAARKEQSEDQNWTFTAQYDGTYQIFTPTGLNLSSREVEVSGGATKDRLVVGGERKQHTWTLESRGDTFILGNPDFIYCAQPIDDDTIMLIERRNTPAQRWILESLDPSNLPTNTTAKIDPGPILNLTPAISSTAASSLVGNTAISVESGTYKLVNVATGNYIYLVPRFGRICVVTTSSYHQPQSAGDLLWTVTHVAEFDYKLEAPCQGMPHSKLHEAHTYYNGPINLAALQHDPFHNLPGTCQLIPVSESPGHFYITIVGHNPQPSSAELSVRAMYDATGEVSTFKEGLQFAPMIKWKPSEKKQQWKFIPA